MNKLLNRFIVETNKKLIFLLYHQHTHNYTDTVTHGGGGGLWEDVWEGEQEGCGGEEVPGTWWWKHLRICSINISCQLRLIIKLSICNDCQLTLLIKCLIKCFTILSDYLETILPAFSAYTISTFIFAYISCWRYVDTLFQI